MGKSTTPTKWFKAVKKAFRSPSKDKPSPKDKGGDAGDEKPLNKQDFPPVSYAAPTPHPLPSFEGVAHNRNESQQQNHGPPPPPALPTTPDPAMTDKKPKEVEEPEQQHSRNGNGNGNVYGVEKHQEDNNDSALSEEDKAAARIQQRFLRNPLALKGLIRLQALVRGQLVRRQAAITLRTMEAIVRVQALFRGRRVRMSKDGRAVKSRISRIQRLSSRVNGDARREGFQGMEPETSEAEHEANKRKRRTAYQLTQQLKRSTPNRSSSFIDCDPDQPHEGWAWLELWTNAKAWESRQLEAAKLDSKDYIEIIPGSSRRTSDYPTTVKEVDFHTLNQVKYHENGNGNGFSHSNPISPMDGKSTVSDSQKKGFFSPKKSTYGSPHLTTPSPAASQDAAAAAAAAASPDGIPPSPNSPEASVKSNFADEEEASLAMEHLVLPEAANGSTTPSDSFSTSNGLHDQPAGPGLEDTLNGEAPAFKVVNGGIIPENVNHHQDNGEDGTQTHPRKEFESPVPVGSMPRPTCRYMSATASAKAKFRQSSNPKNRTAGATTPELANEASPSPVAAAPPPRKQRKSVGGGTTQAINVGNAKAAQSPNKTPVAFGTGKTTNRRNPSPKTIALKEKPRSVDVGHDGVLPIHRNSWGNGDDKRWRT